MTRRGHGEGSIFRAKDGRWVAMLDLGYVLGRRKRKAFYGETRRAVQERLAAALRDTQKGLPVVAERQTVAEHLESWLNACKTTVRARTWLRYEQYVRIHALPEIGRVPLARLAPQHLQKLYARRIEAGSAPVTVAHLHAVLHRALSQAERWGLVPRNVATLVDPPRIARRTVSTLSPDQTRALLEAAEADRLGALYVLAVTTGMRQGELLALRWQLLDLEGASLRVQATLQRVGGEMVFSEPKTAASRRRVMLTRRAVAALRRHRVAQAEERIRLGDVWQDNDLVFPNEVGRPLEASNLLRRSFAPLLARAGIARLRFHDLRHTAATLMLGQGIHPKVVSEMLGHSQISVTLDLYSHVTSTMQRDATGALDALLAK